MCEKTPNRVASEVVCWLHQQPVLEDVCHYVVLRHLLIVEIEPAGLCGQTCIRSDCCCVFGRPLRLLRPVCLLLPPVLYRVARQRAGRQQACVERALLASAGLKCLIPLLFCADLVVTHRSGVCCAGSTVGGCCLYTLLGTDYVLGCATARISAQTAFARRALSTESSTCATDRLRLCVFPPYVS